MIISDGYDTKKLTLYPPAKPSMETENPFWVDCEEGDVQPLLTIGKSLSFKNETEDDTINSFISDPMVVTQEAYQTLDNVMDETKQEEITQETLTETIIAETTLKIVDYVNERC
jgi:hypothetical protein